MTESSFNLFSQKGVGGTVAFVAGVDGVAVVDDVEAVVVLKINNPL